jgi:hypothetical protein
VRCAHVHPRPHPPARLGAREHLVRLAERTECLAGIEQRCFIDIDSLLRPVYGLWGSRTSDRRLEDCFVVLSLVYLLVGRAFALIVLRGRGEAAKDVELLVLRHEVAGAAPTDQPAAVGAG